MTTPNANKPAFPWHQLPGNQDNIGLTKLEALAGLIAAGIATNCAYRYKNIGPWNQKIAIRAMQIADCLLAELEKWHTNKTEKPISST